MSGVVRARLRGGLTGVCLLAAVAACSTSTTELVTLDPQAGVAFGRPSPPAGYVPGVRWAETPDAKTMAAAFPARARSLGLDGSAGMECRLEAEGRLSDCRVVNEAPAGFGFGAATVGLAPQFRAEFRTADGAALTPGRPIRLGVGFSSGERYGSAGLCQAIALALEGDADDPAAREAAAADLRARSPLLARDLDDAKARLARHAPVAAVLAREEPESAGRMSEGCLGRPRAPSDLSRLHPTSVRVWIDPQGAAHSVIRPEWTAVPQGEAVARVYPAAARAREVDGRGAVQCRVTTSGVLSGCVVVEDTPPGFGFGAATLRLVPLFRMAPETVDGQPVESVVTAPVQYLMPR